MEMDYSDKIYAFDTLYTSNQIQMLKIVLPYIDVSMRKSFAVIIKYLEFQYMMQLPHHAFGTLCGHETNRSFDTTELLQEIRPLCGEKEQQQLDQIGNMLQSFTMFSQMQEMMNFMGGESGLGDISSLGNLGNLGDLGNLGGLFGEMDLSSLLSPEQLSLFELLKQSQES
ncbi:MAG: hypothetical protein R3Y67_07100 [Eubacteriales bacterium]